MMVSSRLSFYQWPGVSPKELWKNILVREIRKEIIPWKTRVIRSPPEKWRFCKWWLRDTQIRKSLTNFLSVHTPSRPISTMPTKKSKRLDASRLLCGLSRIYRAGYFVLFWCASWDGKCFWYHLLTCESQKYEKESYQPPIGNHMKIDYGEQR